MISLIITAYNEEAYLSVCLNSLANQQNKNFKLILVNNGSTDQTLKVMQEFSKLNIFPTIVVTENKLGKVNALNTGLKYSLEDKSIDRLAFSDADSYFDSDWSQQISKIKTDFGYTTEMFINIPELRLVSRFRSALLEYTKMLYFTRKNLGGFMNLGNCIVNKDAFIKVGGFDPKWTKSLDTLLTIKLLRSGYSGSYFDGNVWFSPRRILQNIDKWCFDQDIREFINLNDQLIWKPIRTIRKDLKDISKDQISKTLEIKSERLFKRLMLLCLFESKPDIKNKVLKFTKNSPPTISECSKLILNSCKSINTQKIFLLE